MKETVLLYNINEEKAKSIKKVLLLLGLRGKHVTEEMYGEKIGVLAGMLTKEEIQNKENHFDSKEVENVPFTEEMLVMCGFSNEKVDKFLMEMRKKKVGKINLKAVLTPYNALWNSYELYLELNKEHKSYSSLPTSLI